MYCTYHMYELRYSAANILMPFAHVDMPLEGCSFPIAALPIESAHHGFKAVLVV